jgi:PAS domain-containing protein
MKTHDLKAGGYACPDAVEASLRVILDLIPIPAYACDAAGLITYFNPLAEAVWRRTPKLRDAADRYCGSFKLYLSDGTAVRHDECWMALALRDGRQYNGCEILIERPDGSRVLGLAHANPLRNGHGQVVGAVNLVVEKTAQKEREADRGKTPLVAPVPYDAALAMIEVGVSALTIAAWATSGFGPSESTMGAP